MLDRGASERRNDGFRLRKTRKSETPKFAKQDCSIADFGLFLLLERDD